LIGWRFDPALRPPYICIMRGLPLAAVLVLSVCGLPLAAEPASAPAAAQQTERQGAGLLQPADSFEPPATRAFPVPPGAGGFGPNGPQSRPSGAPRVGESVPVQSRSPATPAPPTPPQTRSQILDDLFTRLAQTSDADEAQGIARAIERIWMRSGSDTADLLMRRAMAALGTENFTLAENLLDAVVVIDPNWSEGWDKRATTRFFADDYAGAMEDISHVLAIEPRHFGALSGMGFILEKSGLNKEALQVFRKTLEIYPQQNAIRKIVDGLTLKVDGRDL
jgi:tetratricopeptide (TPR) repeat protein